MTLVLVFTVFSVTYANRDDHSTITPNYVPCDYTGGQHVYVDGHEWQNTDSTMHQHKISDGYGGYVNALCEKVITYRYIEQRCPCGASKTKRSKIAEDHYLQ